MNTDPKQGVGGFMPPRAAVPVAGPGVSEQTTQQTATPVPPAPSPVTAAPAPPPPPPPKPERSRGNAKRAPKKAAPKRKAKPASRKKAKSRRGPAASVAAAHAAQPAPAGSSRRTRKGLDVSTVMDVLAKAKRKDVAAINAVVQIFAPLSRPARMRVAQAVGTLFP